MRMHYNRLLQSMKKRMISSEKSNSRSSSLCSFQSSFSPAESSSAVVESVLSSCASESSCRSCDEKPSRRSCDEESSRRSCDEESSCRSCDEKSSCRSCDEKSSCTFCFSCSSTKARFHETSSHSFFSCVNHFTSDLPASFAEGKGKDFIPHNSSNPESQCDILKSSHENKNVKPSASALVSLTREIESVESNSQNSSNYTINNSLSASFGISDYFSSSSSNSCVNNSFNVNSSYVDLCSFKSLRDDEPQENLRFSSAVSTSVASSSFVCHANSKSLFSVSSLSSLCDNQERELPKKLSAQSVETRTSSSSLSLCRTSYKSLSSFSSLTEIYPSSISHTISNRRKNSFSTEVPENVRLKNNNKTSALDDSKNLKVNSFLQKNRRSAKFCVAQTEHIDADEMPVRKTCSMFTDLPLLRVTAETDRNELFRRKIKSCCVVFDFNSPDTFVKEKEAKRETLLEIVDYVSNTKNCFTEEEIIQDIIYMISVNIFRPLSPTSSLNFIVYDAEEEEPKLDSAWPHLQIIYEFFLRFIVSCDVEVKIVKKYIDQKFILKLLELFNSEDPREREYLKTILHRIYGKIMGLRSFIRKAIQNIFFKVIYDSEMNNGVSELLEILGSIINGFTIPLKDEHKLFLEKTLIPLHKSKCINTFFHPLTYCLTQFVAKDNRLSAIVISGLLRFWPLVNTPKEVLFINELEEILELMHPPVFQSVMLPLFSRVAECIKSPHFQVAERALFLWSNDSVVKLVNEHRHSLFPMIISALYANSKYHWNSTVHGLTYNVLKLLAETDPTLFDECSNKNLSEEKREDDNEKARKLDLLLNKFVKNEILCSEEEEEPENREILSKIAPQESEVSNSKLQPWINATICPEKKLLAKRAAAESTTKPKASVSSWSSRLSTSLIAGSARFSSGASSFSQEQGDNAQNLNAENLKIKDREVDNKENSRRSFASNGKKTELIS